jgi:hypothetical protein
VAANGVGWFDQPWRCNPLCNFLLLSGLFSEALYTRSFQKWQQSHDAFSTCLVWVTWYTEFGRGPEA